MMASPAAHTHIATLTESGSTPQSDAAVIKQVADRFPMVTSVRVREALETVGGVVSNLVLAVRGASAVTLISAILLLFHQKWRTSINRFAEAMTLFAVACAGIFPIIHTGRIWVALMPGFLIPAPDANYIWPQFRSPLEWDVFAVSTYFTVSTLFWYMGMIPDPGAIRDRARTWWRKAFYSVLSMGWRGGNRQCHAKGVD